MTLYYTTNNRFGSEHWTFTGKSYECTLSIGIVLHQSPPLSTLRVFQKLSSNPSMYIFDLFSQNAFTSLFSHTEVGFSELELLNMFQNSTFSAYD